MAGRTENVDSHLILGKGRCNFSSNSVLGRSSDGEPVPAK